MTGSRKRIILFSLLLFFYINHAKAEDSSLTPEKLLEKTKEKLSLNSAKEENGKFVQKVDKDLTVEYTLIPEFQSNLNKYVKKLKVPYASFVAIEPSTGKVLAIAESSTMEKKGSVSLSSIFPAASIFKIISSAALLESKQVTAGKVTCYHGGSSILLENNIIDSRKLDKKCRTLKSAFAHSTNSVIGKLVINNLTNDDLLKMAEKFGFNKNIDFIFKVSKSVFKMPKNRLDLARTAAGFTNSTLSPIHGAVIGAAIALGGILIEPKIVQKISTDEKEYVINFKEYKTAEKGDEERFLSQDTVNDLKDMMIETTISGTGRKYFNNRPVSLEGIDVAVKTGSLTMPSNNHFHTSWMVGFAPAGKPEIAFASLVVNQKGKWKIKSGILTRKALDLFFSLKIRDKKRS
jgi:cell division protein FtsI/penicillin-binding protein 2